MPSAHDRDIQRPTHPRLHVRDVRDALIILEAVRIGRLRPVTRRLNEDERAAFIQSGSVFVWAESEDELGLKRWTDGRVWSQSRMREPYLFYDEKIPETHPGNSSEVPQSSQPVYRFVDGSSRSSSSSSIMSHLDRSQRHPGLVKQAYSAIVTVPGDKARKWHLTCYFTYADLPSLPSVDDDTRLGSIVVPQGIYRSGKARSRHSDSFDGAHYSPPPTASPKPCPMLPPLRSALPSIGPLASPNGAREARCAEDQRVPFAIADRRERQSDVEGHDDIKKGDKDG